MTALYEIAIILAATISVIGFAIAFGSRSLDPKEGYVLNKKPENSRE